MIAYQVLADLATERRNTFLAEAEASRHARQTRLHRRSARAAGGRRSPLSRVLDGLRSDRSRQLSRPFRQPT